MPDKFEQYEVLPQQDKFSQYEVAPEEDKFSKYEITPKVSTFESMLQGTAQGLTLGLSDEILGAAVAGWDKFTGKEKADFTDLYHKNQKMFEARIEAAQEQHPVAYWSADLLSTIATPGLVARLGGKLGAKALTRVPELVTTVPGVATLGGVEAITRGKAELIGPDADWKAAAGEAAVGVTLGAVGGVVVGAAARGISKGVKWVRRGRAKLPETEQFAPIKNLQDQVEQKIVDNQERLTILSDDIANVSAETKLNLIKKTNQDSFDYFAERASKNPKLLKLAKEVPEEVEVFVESAEGSISTSFYKDTSQLMKQMKSEKIFGDLETYSAYKEWQDVMKRYTAWLNKEEVPTSARSLLSFRVPFEQTARQGLVNSKSFRQFQATEYAVEILSKQNQAVVKPYTDATLGVFGRNFMDLRYVFSQMDNTLGTEISPFYDLSLVNSYNKATATSKTWTRAANSWEKARRKAGIDAEEVTKIVENKEYREGVWERLTDAQKDVVNQVTNYNKIIRETANKSGMIIDEIQNYMPHVGKSVPDSVMVMKRMAKEINVDQLDDRLSVMFAKTQPNTLEREVVNGLRQENPAVVRYVEGLEYLFDTEITAVSEIKQLTLKIDQLPRIKTQVGYEARAAFHRTGNIPEFLREKDAYQLMLSYGKNVSQTMHLASPLQMLDSFVPVLETAGLNDYSNYLRTFTMHMSGVPTGLVKQARLFEQRFQVATESWFMNHPELEKFKGAALVLPSVIRRCAQSIYPNLLGWNPRAILRNYTQPFLMTAGEIGGGEYGYRLATKNFVKVAALHATPAKYRATKRMLIEKGFAPASFEGERAALSKGLRENIFIAKMGTAANKLDDFAMIGFSESDFTNRLVTYGMAKDVTKDLMDALRRKSSGVTLSRDNNIVLRFVDKMEPGYRSMLKRELEKAPTAKRLEEIIGQYLIYKTQLTYGKVGLNEFGRHMGPIFSMFTKWPTTVASELIVRTKQDGMKGARVLAEKYFAPLIMLSLIDSIKHTEETYSPRKAAVMYKNGFTDWSPLWSLRVNVPPIVGTAKTAMDEVLSIVAGDKTAQDIKKNIDKNFPRFMQTYTPGAVWYNTYEKLYNIAYDKKLSED